MRRYLLGLAMLALIMTTPAWGQTFGNDSVFTSGTTLNATYNVAHFLSTFWHTGVAGDSVDSFAVYLNSFNNPGAAAQCAIYDINGGVPRTLIGTSNQETLGTSGWVRRVFECASPIALSAGVQYTMAVNMQNNSVGIGSIAAGGGNWHMSYNTSGTWPDPWVHNRNTTRLSGLVYYHNGGGAAADTYSGKFPRGIARGIGR